MIPENASSWVGALAFDPTSLPSGSWNMTPAAKGWKGSVLGTSPEKDFRTKFSFVGSGVGALKLVRAEVRAHLSAA